MEVQGTEQSADSGIATVQVEYISDKISDDRTDDHHFNKNSAGTQVPHVRRKEREK